MTNKRKGLGHFLMVIGGILFVFSASTFYFGILALIVGQFLIALILLAPLILGIISLIYGRKYTIHIKGEKKYAKIFCPNCGEKSEVDKRFCSKCGHILQN